ncbi:unnamed protein product [Urochloa humidicola]
MGYKPERPLGVSYLCHKKVVGRRSDAHGRRAANTTTEKKRSRRPHDTELGAIAAALGAQHRHSGSFLQIVIPEALAAGNG